MSFLKDNLDFERFQLKDWWRKAKDSPEQLIFGAADPFSAKVMSKITGKEYEPFIDQMGGPYGGSALSVGGSTDGGVYGRARESGINTKSARNVHNVAHAIAAFKALSAGSGAFGGGEAGGATAGYTPASGDLAAIEASQISQGAGAVNPSMGMSPAAAGGGFNWQDMLRQQQPQQQNTQSSPKENAYAKFLESQERAQRVAYALSERRRSTSDDYAEQVDAQRRRRAIAQAMMG